MDQYRVLRVVVASPSDVKAERDIVPRVIEEVNRNIAHRKGLHLDLYRWETDSHPGFHPLGPQGIIDHKLKIEKCDLLIGIFWRRFGTPVSDAKSGTEHEFRLAYKTWKRKKKPQIFVYFSRKSYTSKSREERDQAARVLRFKKDFPKEGLWWDYKGKASFEHFLRNHITSFVNERRTVRKKTQESNSAAPTLPLRQLTPVAVEERSLPAPAATGETNQEIEPEPTLLSLLDTSFPRLNKKWLDYPIQFEDGTFLQIRAALYFDLTFTATFLGFYIPSSPDAVSACSILAKHTREIAEHLAETGLRVVLTSPGENPRELQHYVFTGKVYIHHQDHLNHQQLGSIEAAFHAAKLEVVLRGPDFLTQAWLAWKQKGQPNITWDTVSLQKLVFENGKFRRFVPNESAAFMFGIFMVVKNPPRRGQKIISAGDVKARLLFKLKQGEYEISPGAWVDEPCSSVRLDVGDTRQLLLAVSESYTSGWRMVANRRTLEGDAVSMDYTRDFPLFSEGSLEIDLINLRFGIIVRTWETRVKWPKDDSLSFTGMKES